MSAMGVESGQRVAPALLVMHKWCARIFTIQFTGTARRLGIASAVATVILTLAYAVVLAIGLLSLKSAQEPIRDPMFAIMECLIIALAPTMVTLMVVVHAWAPAGSKVFSLASLVFMGMLAGITVSVHFAILTLSRDPTFAHQPWTTAVFPFRWPSVAYALDILAWDFLFALSVLFAAAVFANARAIRWLLVLSGLLALAGLLGIPFADMRLRNIGIVGYVVMFPIAAALIGSLFYRTRAA